MTVEARRQCKERLEWMLRHLGDVQKEIHTLAALVASQGAESVPHISRPSLPTYPESAGRPARRDKVRVARNWIDNTNTSDDRVQAPIDSCRRHDRSPWTGPSPIDPRVIRLASRRVVTNDRTTEHMPACLAAPMHERGCAGLTDKAHAVTLALRTDVEC